MKKQKNSLKKTEAELIDDPLAGDMSDFNLDGIKDGSWQVAKYELREKKDKVLSLRLSQKLLNELKKQAKKSGLDTQKFVRIILENTVRKKAGHNAIYQFALFLMHKPNLKDNIGTYETNRCWCRKYWPCYCPLLRREGPSGFLRR